MQKPNEVCRLGRALRIFLMAGATVVLGQAQNPQTTNPNRTVGPQKDGSVVASDNQTLTPAGKIIELGSPVRAKAIALNPNLKTNSGAVLLMGSPQPIIVFNTATGQVLQRFIPAFMKGAESTTSKAGSFTGITYSADGKSLFFSQDDNHVVIANVNPQTGLLTNGQSVELPGPPADGRPYHNAKSINPGGIAVSEDGKRAYVALNAANTLGVIDLAASPAKLIAQIPVGNAPNSVVIHGKYAYVSNEGGRPATSEDFTNDSDGTPIVVDRKDAFAITGTVSVVDLAAGKEVKTIKVGLHPAGMTISGSDLYVANAYSDSLSVIDLNTDEVVRTIDLSVPIAGGVFGSGPNGVAVTDDGRAYVTLGQANAVAVVNLQGRDAHPVIGYIPTGYFPTSIAYDKAQKQLVVADDKGLGTHVPARSGGLSGFSTHQDTGTVNLIPLPNANQLARFSKQVFDNNHWNLTTNIEVGPEYIDAHAAPVAVPRHIGEPSLIKYVFLVIKENRTYDQMLGDVPWGNGDPSLAIFASAVPNQHAFVKRFPLLDNVYAPSRQSADGHPWIGMSGSFYSNDILSPDWIRSYPGGNADDALTYTPKGFLWTAAEAKGLSARLYGEWSNGAKIAKKPDGTNYTWSDFYRTALCKEGKAPQSSCIVPDDAVSVTSDDSLGGQNHGPALSAVQSHDSRPVPNGLLDTRVPAPGCSQSGSQSDDSVASGRPHRRNHKGPTLSDQLPGRQRSGAWPHGGRHQPQQGMGAIGDLRRGRRFPGRRRSRGWPPPAGFCHQPLYGGSAGARPGQGDSYNLHSREHQSHHREHSGYAAADAVRSGGIPHVRRVSKHARSDAIRPSVCGHPSRPGTRPAG